MYDATGELHERGLIDVHQTSPKEFWSISSETTGRSFEQEFQQRAQILRTALDEIEPAERRAEQRGVWTVNGQAAVTNRVLEFFETAEDEIVYMTVEALLTDDLIDALSAANERGVRIKIGGISTEVQERIQADIPDAEMFESLWVWSDTPAGRLMMADNRKTLASALVNGEDASASDPRAETAIWGDGTNNRLVVVLKANLHLAP